MKYTNYRKIFIPLCDACMPVLRLPGKGLQSTSLDYDSLKPYCLVVLHEIERPFKINFVTYRRDTDDGVVRDTSAEGARVIQLPPLSLESPVSLLLKYHSV